MTRYTYTRTQTGKPATSGGGTWKASFADMLEALTNDLWPAVTSVVNGNKASITIDHRDGCVTAFEIEAA